MRRLTTFLLVAFLLVSGVACSSGDSGSESTAAEGQSSKAPVDETTARIQADLRRNYTALYTADLDTVIELTHPDVIRAMGGEATAMMTIEPALENLQSMGTSLESVSFPVEPQFAKSRINEYAIMETITVVAAGGRRVETRSFYICARRIGTEAWGYIDGARVNADNVKSIFPDFPEALVIPTGYTKPLP